MEFVRMAKGKRKTMAHTQENEINEDVCKACQEESTRVLLLCDGCPAAFHLKCLNPPLARTPKGKEWYCSDCISTRKNNKDTSRESAVKKDEDITSNEEELEENRAKKETVQGKNNKKTKAKSTVSTPRATTTTTTTTNQKKKRNLEKMVEGNEQKRVKRTAKEVMSISSDDAKDSDDDEVDDVPLASLQAKKVQVKATKGTEKASFKPVQVAATTGRKKLKRNAKVAASSKKKKKAIMQVDDDDDDEDDDNDSDFLPGEGKSEGDDDDDNDDDDDDFVNESIVPRPSIANRRRVATPPSRPPPASVRARAPASARNQNRGNHSDTDSLTIDQPDVIEIDDDEEEDEEERQLANGPIYFVEYAPNGRAKCKSCEGKLPAEILRIGVKVKHSLFGINTYYKCYTCTQICFTNSPKEAKEVDEKLEVKKQENGENDEPIRGFRRLRPTDQAKLMAYMKENTENGVDDERVGINDSHYQRKARMPEKEPSNKIVATLLPYQREALAWMCAQEKSVYRGGILADEMGMGKTLQAISVIVEKKRFTQQDAIKEAPLSTSKSTDLFRGGTLVVCPLVAVTQWKSEIEKFVEPGYLSIYIHHGPKRLTLAEAIAQYDIVLTTYSILESEIRKSLMGDKIACQYCKKKFLPDKLVFHNKYFCGPNAKKTAKQQKQQTRRKQQQNEYGNVVKGKTNTKAKAKEKQTKKTKQTKKKAAGDTSSDEESEASEKSEASEASEESDAEVLKNLPKKKKKALKGKAPLHLIDWTRIILDEAHYIKDRRSNTARGVFALKSEYKWCLTGTPLQNRIGELFSLIRFLQIKSYAYYHCRKCPCQILDFNFPEGKCLHCEHGSISHFSYFTKKIVQPIQGYGYVAEGKIAMIRLQNEVLQHILLRRTKQGRADDLCLPPKLIRIRKDQLDERENDFYQAIYTQSQAQFNTYVSSGTLLNNYAHIFDLLIRLRQAVDHPYLVIYSKSNPALQVPLLTTDTLASTGISSTQQRPVMDQQPLLTSRKRQDNEEEEEENDDDGEDAKECGICHEDVEDAVITKCSHTFCRVCVEEYMESLPMEADATCPVCEKPLTVDLTTSASSSKSELDRILETQLTPQQVQAKKTLSRYKKHSILHRLSDLQSFQTSTKIEALMQELEHLRIRDPSGKAIIFSQFVNMLDIIQHRLTLGGIKCVKLSGSMSMDARDKTLKAFREDSSITVFLISLKAGGVALNLTVASHIFLMDPWWNPAAENQAIDRVHRLGQFKPVQATRFIIAGTVEERILKLQEKKQLVFEGTVGASVSALTRLTEEDLRFLFNK